jgi:preprotein translocase subunit SecG
MQKVTAILTTVVVALLLVLGYSIRMNYEADQKIAFLQQMYESTHTDLNVCWQTYRDLKK